MVMVLGLHLADLCLIPDFTDLRR